MRTVEDDIVIWMEKVFDKKRQINIFFENLIWWIAMPFFSIISFLTFFFTTELADGYKGAYDVKFSPLIVIVLILITVVVIFLFCYGKENELKRSNIVKTVFFIGLFESMLWIFIADVGPAFDSLDLVYATEALRGSTDGLAICKWEYANYLSRFPFQTSIVCLLYLCMSIAGENYIIFYEIINCFACAFAMAGIVILTGEISDNTMSIALSGLMTILFFPMVLYCTFIYGNIIALPFLIYSFYWQKKALSGEKNVWCCLAISIGLIKSTMIIGALAECCVYLFQILQGVNKKKFLIYILCMVCTLKASTLFSAPVNSFIEKKVNIDLDEGVPSIAWITMGLGGGKEYQADMENDDILATDIKNAGYYDGFVWALSSEEYSRKAMKSISIKYLLRRIQHFVSDPDLMLRYIAEKFAIEWTNPDFESFLASNWDYLQVNGYNQAKRSMTKLTASFYYGTVHDVLFNMMDIMQTLLSMGTLWWLIFNNKGKIARCVELIVVLGYAAVFLLWENKTQYMFPAYLLMIPMASNGWRLMCCLIIDLGTKVR